MNRFLLTLIAVATLVGITSCKQPAARDGDLTVTMVSTPVTVTEGIAFFFDYRVSFSGSTPSSSFEVAEYYSTDATWSVDDPEIRSYTVSPLAPDEYTDKTGTETIGSDGTYYVFVVIDPDDLVNEENESNNTASLLVTVDAAPSPDIDLVPGIPYHTAQIDVDATSVPITVPVTNLGDDPFTTDFSIDLYIVDNSDLDLTLLTPVPTAVTTDMAGNSTIDVDVSVDFTGYALGEWVIFYADIDTANAVTETNEINNESTSITVGGKMIGSSNYSVRFETFSVDTDVDTYLVIYDESDPAVEIVNLTGGGSGSFAATDIASLSSGDVLLVKVMGALSGGPYGFTARALTFANPANLPIRIDNLDDPGEPDSGTDGTSMVGATEITVGGAMSRYTIASFADEDWFRVTIP